MTTDSTQKLGMPQHLIPTYCDYINKYVLQAAKRGKSEVPGEHHFVALYLVPRLSLFSFLGVPHYVNPDGMKAIAGDVVYFSYAPQKDVCYIPTPRLKIEVKLENPIDRSIQLTRTQYYHWIKQVRTPEEQGKLVLGERPDQPEQPDLFVGISQHGIVILPWGTFRDTFIKEVYSTGLPDLPKIKGRPSNTGSFAMKRFEWAKDTNSRFYLPYSKKLEDWVRLEVSFVDSLKNQCAELTSERPIQSLEPRLDV
jgi:hypothetical protein